MKLQQRAIRAAAKATPDRTTLSIFKEKGILPVKELWQFEVALFMHRYNFGNYPIHFENLFSRNSEIHSYNTRASTCHNYSTKRVRLEQSKKSILFCGPHIWNAIPQKTRELSFSAFKRNYKKSLLNDLDLE